MSAYLLGTDILGWSASDAASLRQAFGVVHGAGKGVLSAFGMGKVADVLEPLEQQAGLLEKPVAAPSAPVSKTGGAGKDAGAKAAATGVQPLPATTSFSAPTPPAEKSRAAKWPWYVGGGVLAVGIVGGLVMLIRH